ncbi:hypothetical protein ACFQ78_19620 [Streptomyces sp. NPDC056519]|uniref:hypothetical protein n=1 Tax=Streptomyces sp. NPDC056519 TaxID=3345849 RepID=UPI0036C18B5D
MEETDYSVDGFKVRVGLVADRVEQLAEDRAGELYRRVVEKCMESGDWYLWDHPEKTAAARLRYLELIGDESRLFLGVCQDVIRLQDQFELEVLRALGIEDAGPGADEPVFLTLSAEVLSERVGAVAARYADEVEKLYALFDDAHARFDSACAEQRRIFRECLTASPGLTSDALEAAVLDVRAATAVPADAPVDEAGACVLAYATAVAEVMEVVVAAGATAEAARTIWSDFPSVKSPG